MQKQKKTEKLYECVSCGYYSQSWYGKCPSCGSWNTLYPKKYQENQESTHAIFVSYDSTKNKTIERITSSISEWDSVLGGGMVPGECILLGGEPGIGKSTLLTSIMHDQNVLYVSGEEYIDRIRERVQRLGTKPKQLLISEETDINKIYSYIKTRKDLRNWLCIVDSLQTIRISGSEGQSFSMNLMREVVTKLIDIAREANLVMILVGHVTKGGEIAGPKLLEHAVDCVLYLEGDRSSSYRLIRSYKNRFGSTQELGVIRMTNHGFESVISDSIFLHSDNQVQKSGSAISALVDCGKIIFVEVQSLVVPTFIPVPKRVIKGIDYNKVLLLLAVLKKYAHVDFDKYDVFVNLAEGFETKSPSCDLAVCFSLFSALKTIPLPAQALYMGEVSLLGEVRPVKETVKIIKQARKLGLNKFFSYSNVPTVQQIKRILNAK